MYNIGDTVVTKIRDRKFSDETFKIKTEIVDVQSDNNITMLCVLYKNGFIMGDWFPNKYQGKNGWYVLSSDVIMSVV